MSSHCFRKTDRQKANRSLMNARAVTAEHTAICTTVPKVFEVLATSLASGNGELSITVFVSTAVPSTLTPILRTIGSQPIAGLHVDGPRNPHGRSFRKRRPRVARSLLTRATLGCLITQLLNSACQ
ncbi:hypothetical protein PROAA_20045 [Candidatus Propionivibrio aalborgensis]|uniref:Uncharacterized protein n=1 Tax=Candidatus Propionivibrio aalborgensis TaxID=1860101 RepID=A0A1A8XSJ4_9RHOO|nr:hypothetical protein PROAA_20045 [Candidatus Propionivibrio aalborgensis]